MDYLSTLLGVDTPAGASLRSAELSLRGPVPMWLAVALLCACAALVCFLYWREQAPMGRLRRLLMAGIRVAVLAVLLLLLFRPVLLAEFAGERPRSIVLLVDNSQSMGQQDRRVTAADKRRVAIAKGLLPMGDVKAGLKPLPAGTPTDPARADLVRWVLKHPDLRLVDGLAKHGPVRPLLFGYSVHGGAAPSHEGDMVAPLLAGFKADEARTSFADAVLEILERKDDALPAAMVVMTDGRDNASKYTLQEAALECGRRGVPLYIYGVGSADAAGLQLKEVGVPNTIFVDDAITVPLRWRAQGLGKGTVQVTVQLGAKIVAKRDIPLQAGEDLRDAISFTVPKGADKEADVEMKVSMRVKGKDAFKDAVTRPVRVVDRKIRVLYIESSPRFVYQFLMAALLRDRRVEPSFLLTSADPKVARSGPPFLAEFPPTREKFFAGHYNVIILGDVSAAYLGKVHLEWIKEFVQNRGGLIAIAGRKNMPAGYENMPLAEVLPAEFSASKPPTPDDVRTQEYPVTLTSAGQRSDMLALADTPDDSLKEWAKLPGFHWQYPVAKLRPGGVSLLVNPRAKMGDQPMPVLMAHYYGKGQVVFMGSDEAWRWRFNEADKVTNRFWGQMVYQLGLPSLLGDASSRVQMALDRAEAVLDRPGAVFVRLLDKDYNPRREAKVEATLIYLDAAPGQEKSRPLALNALPGRPGEYRGELAHERPGRWQIKLAKPDEYTFPFHVDVPPRHELEEIGLAEAELRDMARLSGGKFYREEDLYKLPGDVKPQTTAFTRRQEIVLWNPLAMIVFVVLITGEWLLRKFANLS